MEQRIRKHPRAQWYDYCEGLYFITICTKEREHYFGYIADGKMNLSETGMFLQDDISAISQHHPDVTIPQWVVMPNHFQGGSIN